MKKLKTIYMHYIILYIYTLIINIINIIASQLKQILLQHETIIQNPLNINILCKKQKRNKLFL